MDLVCYCRQNALAVLQQERSTARTFCMAYGTPVCSPYRFCFCLKTTTLFRWWNLGVLVLWCKLEVLVLLMEPRCPGSTDVRSMSWFCWQNLGVLVLLMYARCPGPVDGTSMSWFCWWNLSVQVLLMEPQCPGSVDGTSVSRYHWLYLGILVRWWCLNVLRYLRILSMQRVTASGSWLCSI